MEKQDFKIMPTDNLLLAGHIEENSISLEVKSNCFNVFIPLINAHFFQFTTRKMTFTSIMKFICQHTRYALNISTFLAIVTLRSTF